MNTPSTVSVELTGADLVTLIEALRELREIYRHDPFRAYSTNYHGQLEKQLLTAVNGLTDFFIGEE